MKNRVEHPPESNENEQWPPIFYSKSENIYVCSLHTFTLVPTVVPQPTHFVNTHDILPQKKEKK